MTAAEFAAMRPIVEGLIAAAEAERAHAKPHVLPYLEELIAFLRDFVSVADERRGLVVVSSRVLWLLGMMSATYPNEEGREFARGLLAAIRTHSLGTPS